MRAEGGKAADLAPVSPASETNHSHNWRNSLQQVLAWFLWAGRLVLRRLWLVYNSALSARVLAGIRSHCKDCCTKVLGWRGLWLCRWSRRAICCKDCCSRTSDLSTKYTWHTYTFTYHTRNTACTYTRHTFKFLLSVFEPFILKVLSFKMWNVRQLACLGGTHLKYAKVRVTFYKRLTLCLAQIRVV